MEKLLRKIETCPSEGIFFKEERVELNNFPANTEWGIVNVFDEVVYQDILGFGGAFTESFAYLYSLLSEKDKKEFLKLYFDRKE